MISKSRLVLALTLTLALAVSGIAFAGDATENDSSVDAAVFKREGKVPRLFKKKAKKVNFEITTQTDFGSTTIGTQANAEELYIDMSKNIKPKLNKAPVCTANINGQTTSQARNTCPDKSLIGTGVAHAVVPDGGGGSDEYNDITTSAFNGPGSNQLRVHTYSPSLGGASINVIPASIGPSPLGNKFGKRISAPDLPELAGDAGGLTLFNLLITKRDKVFRSNCKKKRMRYSSLHIYDDGSSDPDAESQTDTDSHKCKRKQPRN